MGRYSGDLVYEWVPFLIFPWYRYGPDFVPHGGSPLIFSEERTPPRAQYLLDVPFSGLATSCGLLASSNDGSNCTVPTLLRSLSFSNYLYIPF